jgi:hypothetical protein
VTDDTLTRYEELCKLCARRDLILELSVDMTQEVTSRRDFEELRIRQKGSSAIMCRAPTSDKREDLEEAATRLLRKIL